MELTNLELYEFCAFNQRFSLRPTTEQKCTLIRIAKINKLFLHVGYKTPELKELC